MNPDTVADTARPPHHEDAITSTISATRRKVWVDVLRGFGIILVVIGHALGGVIDTNGANAKQWFLAVFAVIYVFHMPLFFFLSGLFVSSRLHSSPERFRQRLLTGVVWPYLLWSAVQSTLIWGAGELANHPVDSLTTSLLRIAILPPSQFWFLYGLFFMHLAALLVGPHRVGAAFLVIGMMAGSLAQLEGMPPVAEAILRMAPFYALGAVFGPALLERGQSTQPLPNWCWSLLALAPIAIAVSLRNAILRGNERNLPDAASAIVSAVNGFQNFFAATIVIAACVVVAMRFGHRMPAWLARCGQLTMPIFLMHIIFISGTRIALARVAPELDTTALLAILCLVGMLGPIAAYFAAARMGAARYLGFS